MAHNSSWYHRNKEKVKAQRLQARKEKMNNFVSTIAPLAANAVTPTFEPKRIMIRYASGTEVTFTI